ncbi:MAG TPA: glycoside hydrolase family 16 protein [Phnomibacter sp.]|nr:glycoside hydrolase family 16 protein [Phnomibacter sp.]
MKWNVLCAGVVGVSLVVACGGSKKNRTDDGSDLNNYQLIWADEFNNDGKPDSSNWRYERGFVRNEEHQWYQEDNAYCKNGLLVIEGRREAKPNPKFKPGGKDWRNRDSIHYTSSSINTSTKHSWQYGRFVMRGKININDGLWPAWWTLGIKGEWPANGEIDIMEYYNKKLLANIASAEGRNKAYWFSNTFPIDSVGGQKWASQFHVWRMDWDEQEIALYVDNVLLNKVAVENLYNRDGRQPHPFKQPHYMLLNLAIGGLNGGDPAHTQFPNKFEVDYVRVYQKK